MARNGTKVPKTANNKRGKDAQPETGPVSPDWALTLVGTSVDLICLCRDSVVVSMNDAGRRMLGLGKTRNVGNKPFADFVHPDYREIVDGLLSRAFDETGSVPLKLTPARGNVIDAEALFVAIGDRGKKTVVVQARDITDRIVSAEALHGREQRLRGILNNVADAIITIDEKGTVQSFNPAAEWIFGYSVREVLGKNIKILMPTATKSKHDNFLKSYLETGTSKALGVDRELIGRRKDGTDFPLELAISELRDGKHRVFTGVLRDITERKKAEESLYQARDLLEQRVADRTRELTQEIADRLLAEDKLRLAAKVIDNLSEAVVIVDDRYKVTAINPAFTDITGFAIAEVQGKHPPFYTALKKDKELFAEMQASLLKHGNWEGEFWDRRKDGEAYAERLSVSAITDDAGKVHQYAMVLSDITKRKQDEEHILYQANYDALTELPNRTLFLDRLEHGIRAAGREKDTLGLMFIDLDGFKLVNDTLGHDVGDLLLKEASKRLLNCVRPSDTVARLGGDEFTVILHNIVDLQAAPNVAQRVLDALAKPFVLRDQEVFVSGSIGITAYPEDGDNALELLKNADSAMYQAKELGKANFQFFTSNLNDEAQQRLVMKNGLIRALDLNELSLHYQPKLEIGTGRITGVEALMRWESAELGMVSPVKFIPVLEETGQVVEVGEWALRIACQQHMTWIEEGLQPLRVAVNLSARQLRENNFVDVVAQVLEETGVTPDNLEIEITESMLMSDAAHAVVALGTLHDMGIHVAMDDFGTGYSSLSYLKKFPIDTIKIDRSFVADIASDPDDAEIIRTIIQMGRTLNRRVVAEGVETKEQLLILHEYLCDEIQGYYYSRPLPAGELSTFLLSAEANQHLVAKQKAG